MLTLPRNNPVNYVLCNQTVTVYHRTDGGEITATVHDRAFFDFQKNEVTHRTGSRETNGFLLVIPGDTLMVHPGDKVILGVGPTIATREDWAAFIPSKVPGLVVIKDVDPKYWDGRMVHVEAGG